MPIEFIGMIATQEQSEIHPRSGPVVDRAFVRAFARAEGDSARLFVLAKALCHVADAPPDGSTIPVESSLEFFAAQEIAFGVVDRLRRDHPRHF